MEAICRPARLHSSLKPWEFDIVLPPRGNCGGNSVYQNHGCPPDIKGTDNLTFLHLETARNLHSHSFTPSTLLFTTTHSFMMKLSYSLLLPILTLGNAVTGSVIAKRELCGQYQSQTSGPYLLDTNLWGEASATSGWQCSGVDYQSGNEISWHTVWDWQGGAGSVKSYTNIQYKFSARQFSSISSIPTTWKWR